MRPSARDDRFAMCVDLARCATLAPAGQTRRTPVACSKRPSRRPCPGLLVVRRRDVPPTIDWQCPACSAAGSITGWEDTDADLRRLQDAIEPGQVGVVMTPQQHQALRDLARLDPSLVPLVFACDIDEHGQAFLSPTVAGDVHCGALVLAAAVDLSPGRRRKHVAELVAALADLAADGFASSGAMSRAMHLALGGAQELAPEDLAPSRPAGRPHTKSPRRRDADARTFQLKVTLRDVKPPVWRRLLVPADILLPALHDVLQLALGWTDSHLHAFRVRQRSFAPPGDFEPIGEDSREVELQALAPGKGARLVYEYDFGDGWCHDIVVEDVRAEQCEAASCVDGRRCGPPEDCGGPWGYKELREAFADPAHAQHEDAREWLSDDFDPEEFDVAEAEAAVRGVRV